MAALKALLIGLSGILGTSAITTSGLYIHTREYIFDHLKNDVIPKGHSDSIWQTLRNKLTSKSNLKNPVLLQLQKEASKDSSGIGLRDWCFSSYDTTFGHIFKNRDQDLLNDVKSACILTIKEKLDQNALSETGKEDKATYRQRLDSLKNYSSTEELKLTKELENLQKLEQKQNNPKEKNWRKLQEWCSSEYKRGFQGDTTNRWKLVNKFCNKNVNS